MIRDYTPSLFTADDPSRKEILGRSILPAEVLYYCMIILVLLKRDCKGRINDHVQITINLRANGYIALFAVLHHAISMIRGDWPKRMQFIIALAMMCSNMLV